jgi:amino acid transporter
MVNIASWIHPVLIVLAIVAIIFAMLNFSNLKRVLIGRPMRSKDLHTDHNKLFWLIALPILAADLYSSVAYGPEAGITEIANLGINAKWLIIPITLTTIVLLIVLIISYIMGVMAYPNGGGAYAIAKDNFTKPYMSLLAASALLIDYVLTVAVSVSAGVQAISSAYPVVAPYNALVSIMCIFVIMIINLRGVSESATVFAWPTFLFMASMVFMIITGVYNGVSHGFVQSVTPPFGNMPKGLTMLLLLKAFSSASSSLTGLETISNAVPIFRKPSSKGAIKAYIILGLITAFTLFGFSLLLYFKGISVNPNNTMLSQLLIVYFGKGIIYQVIIWSTFVVLILAANSTFTGFPQLAALVAADRFLPRSLALRGDRLGYSNGIVVLSALSALLIEAFQANTNALIPLYAIGVFVAFTVAEIGLTRRWLRIKGKGWKAKALMNTVGGFLTAVVAIIFAVTKFTGGAWIVLIVLPSIYFAAISIRKHYDQVANELRIDLSAMRPESHRVISVVLISGVNRVVLNTVSFAKSIDTDVIAVYIGFDDESIEKMEAKWLQWGEPCRLVTLKSEYRSLLLPLTRFLTRLENWEGGRPDHIHVMISQFVPKKWWHYIMHNQTSFMIRTWLLRHKDIIITTIPYHLHQ